MTGPSQKDQRAVDEAIRSVQSLPLHATKVQSVVVPQKNPAKQSLDEAIKSADLAAMHKSIVAVMSDPEVRFQIAAQGHERPDARMYGRSHAVLDSEDRFHSAVRDSRRSGMPFRDDHGLPNPDFVVNLPPPRYKRSQDDARNKEAQRAADEVRGWMTPEFLGDPRSCERLNRTPPVFTVEGPDFFDTIGWRREGNAAVGSYFNGTNHLALSEGMASDKTQLMIVAAHEQLHYASWLGGGHDVRWMDDSGKPVVKDFEDVRWFHEGMTELIAQQLVRSKSYKPGEVSYPPEVLVASYLMRTLDEAAGQGKGAPMLRAAYTTGDFTEVRTLIDSKLGKGSFNRLIGFKRGAEALAFLEERIPAEKRASWDADPINKTARSEVESGNRMAAMKQAFAAAAAGMSKEKEGSKMSK